MALDGLNAWTETYISLVSYTILHMIFVIASDFVEALNIPPLNIGIYVDKLAAIRALLMVLADLLEWGITQKACSALGTSSTSARVVGAFLWFLAMLACRCHYLRIVYRSENKSLVTFITLSVEGFWFGMFQMGFFAIGPEYNAFTSLAIHAMGNFIFFFQLILESAAETRPNINALYRVRVHAWICVASTAFGLPQWFRFLFISRIKDLRDGLATALADDDPSNTNTLKKAAREANSSSSQAKEQLENVASAAGSLKGAVEAIDVNYRIEKLGEVSTKAETLAQKINEVNTGNITSPEDKKKALKNVLSDVAYKAGELAAALKLSQHLASDGASVAKNAATALESVKAAADRIARQIQPGGSSGGGASLDNVWSPLLLFPVGSFAEDFTCPGILPFAFLDPEKASIVNYAMPVFFFMGALIVLLVNDVFASNGFASGVGDSKFKQWSEGTAPGWHAVWLMNVPKYAAFFISIFAIHGIYPGLRKIVQSRWRVMLLTFNIIFPRSVLEVMGYVGVANYAIASHNFDVIAWHDVLAMFCRFFYGKLAVGYNWTRVSLGYVFLRDTANFHGFQSRKPCLSVKNPSMSVFEHDQNFVNFSDFLDRLPNFVTSH